MVPNDTQQDQLAQRVKCPNCGTIYQRPSGHLSNYHCGVCGYPALIPLTPDNDTRQAAMAVAGAAAGLAMAGVPGAIVGGIIGYLTGSGK